MCVSGKNLNTDFCFPFVYFPMFNERNALTVKIFLHKVGHGD